LVVSEISGRGRSVAAAATRPARPRRGSGSPPVRRTSVIPSRYTAIAIRRAISPSVSSAGLGSPEPAVTD
jgi:hypothetical protein